MIGMRPKSSDLFSLLDGLERRADTRVLQSVILNRKLVLRKLVFDFLLLFENKLANGFLLSSALGYLTLQVVDQARRGTKDSGWIEHGKEVFTFESLWICYSRRLWIRDLDREIKSERLVVVPACRMLCRSHSFRTSSSIKSRSRRDRRRGSSGRRSSVGECTGKSIKSGDAPGFYVGDTDKPRGGPSSVEWS